MFGIRHSVCVKKDDENLHKVIVFNKHYRWFYWQVRKEQNEELKTDGTAEEGIDSSDSEGSGTHTPEKERF